MGLPATKVHGYTSEEYFEISEEAENRYEYEHGRIIAMGTTSEPHNDLVFNLTRLLKDATVGKGCKVHFETIRLEVEEAGKYYLPDVMLSCDEKDHQDFKTKRHPLLVIEVLSESSEIRDRGDKFHAYLRLPSLQYYVLVSQDKLKVELFSNMETGGWAYNMFDRNEDLITLEKIGVKLSVADIYQEVTLVPYASSPKVDEK